eukprot:scaffold442_cov268-Pinguiococcus_pyrenoidosus.AAC.81
MRKRHRMMRPSRSSAWGGGRTRTSRCSGLVLATLPGPIPAPPIESASATVHAALRRERREQST